MSSSGVFHAGSNNTSEVICDELYDYESAPYRIANFYVMMIVTLFGLVGNGLVIAVFSRIKRKRSSDIFLLALAIYDILTIITFSMYAHVSAYPYVFGSGNVNDFTLATVLTVTILPFDFIVRSGNTYIIVLVSVDRYIHACHPVFARKWCTKRRAEWQVLIVLIATCLYSIPRFFEYYIIFDSIDELADKCFGFFLNYPPGSPATDEVYIYLYCVIMYITVIYVIPLTILSYINFFLIRVIKERLQFGVNTQATKDVQEKETKKRSKDKIIVTLVIVTVIFSICQVPDMVLQILWRLPVLPEHTVDFSVFAHDLIIINSSINFVIYTFTYKRFKAKLRRFFCFACDSAQEVSGATVSSKEPEWSKQTSSS